MKYWIAFLVLYFVPAHAFTEHSDGSITWTAEELAIIRDHNGQLSRLARQYADENLALRREIERLRTQKCI